MLTTQTFSIVMPNYVWQVGLVFGVLVGAYVSAKLSKNKYPEVASVWKKELGISSKKVKYLMSFIGGMFLVLGARLAKGCTSGNGISGVAQMDVSSFIALGCMFLFAILTVQIIRILKGK